MDRLHPNMLRPPHPIPRYEKNQARLENEITSTSTGAEYRDIQRKGVSPRVLDSGNDWMSCKFFLLALCQSCP